MAAAARLSQEEIARRTPLWVALSDLFLDTQVGALEHRYIARVIDEGGFSEEEALAILRDEVGPAFSFNLRLIAGQWGCWPEEYVVERVLETLKTPRRPPFRDGVVESVIAKDWPVIRAKLLTRRAKSIRAAEPTEVAAIDALLRTTSGDRALALIHRLREDGDVLLETVATEESRIVAHALFCRVDHQIEGWGAPASAALAGVSVIREAQVRELDVVVVCKGLDLLMAGETRWVFAVGDPKLCETCGFTPQGKKSIAPPLAKKRLLGVQIGAPSGAPGGVVRFPAALSAPP